jgi:acetyltransferase-like isoleucine patch superfamily enzyme
MILNDSASINLKGRLFLGFPVTGSISDFAHNCNTVVSMGKNASLVVNGDVHIGPGCTIRIADDAVLELGGKNMIAHNTTIIASKKISIGEGSAISWGVNLIDDDHHSFYTTDGKKLKRIRKTLVIGSNVGIQMNVTIPSGGVIGSNSIIAANTVIRKNVPENSLVYSVNELKTLNNITTGFQFNDLE